MVKRSDAGSKRGGGRGGIARRGEQSKNSGQGRKNSGKIKSARKQIVVRKTRTRRNFRKKLGWKKDNFRNVCYGLYSSTDSRNRKKSLS